MHLNILLKLYGHAPSHFPAYCRISACHYYRVLRLCVTSEQSARIAQLAATYWPAPRSGLCCRLSVGHLASSHFICSLAAQVRDGEQRCKLKCAIKDDMRPIIMHQTPPRAATHRPAAESQKASSSNGNPESRSGSTGLWGSAFPRNGSRNGACICRTSSSHDPPNQHS